MSRGKACACGWRCSPPAAFARKRWRSARERASTPPSSPSRTSSTLSPLGSPHARPPSSSSSRRGLPPPP
eukprot:5991704-Pleurochrysis_carterae.AAC.1